MDYHTKQRVTQFWKDWQKMSPEDWLYQLKWKNRKAQDLLYQVPTILYLEGKFTEEQKISITKMLRSPDLGDAQVALTILKTLMPKIFKYRNK